MTEHDEEPEDGLDDRPRVVGREHQGPTSDPVGEHATGEEEEHERKDPRSEHDPDLAGVTSPSEYGEGEGDRCHARADRRGEAPEEVAPEIPLRQDTAE